jgi:hypothetical protein
LLTGIGKGTKTFVQITSIGIMVAGLTTAVSGGAATSGALVGIATTVSL